MPKYKLKALSVVIGGKRHKKEEGEVFDIDGKYKSLKLEVESAFKAGYLEEIKDSKPKSKTIQKSKK